MLIDYPFRGFDCVKSSKSLDEDNTSDNNRLGHKFNKEYNDDYVSVFRKTEDDDVESIARKIISISCNTIFAFPDPNVLESIVPYRSNKIGSDHSNISGDLSDCESLKEYTKKIMKDGGKY